MKVHLMETHHEVYQDDHEWLDLLVDDDQNKLHFQVNGCFQSLLRGNFEEKALSTATFHLFYNSEEYFPLGVLQSLRTLSLQNSSSID